MEIYLEIPYMLHGVCKKSIAGLRQPNGYLEARGMKLLYTRGQI